MSAMLREKVTDAITDNVDPALVLGSLSIDGVPAAVTEIMAEVVTPLVDMLTYIELHMTRYQWKVLTTAQKNLLADLIDEERALNYPDDHTPMERWWQ